MMNTILAKLYASAKKKKKDYEFSAQQVLQILFVDLPNGGWNNEVEMQFPFLPSLSKNSEWLQIRLQKTR